MNIASGDWGSDSDDDDFDPNAPGSGSEGEGEGESDDDESGDDDDDDDGDEGDDDDATPAAAKPLKRDRDEDAGADGADTSGSAALVSAENGGGDNAAKGDADALPTKKAKISDSNDEEAVAAAPDGDDGDEEAALRKEKKRLKKKRKEEKARKKEEKRLRKEEKRRKKKEKKKEKGEKGDKAGGGFFDTEAAEDSEDSGSDDDSDDGDDSENEYRKDGFVVDSEDEDSVGDDDAKGKDDDDDSDDDGLFETTKTEGDEDGEGKKKKKKKNELSRLRKAEETALDADDLDLINEAQAQQQEEMEMNAAATTEPEEEGDEIMPERAGRDFIDDEDAMDDFIEDDLVEEGGVGEPARRRAPRAGARALQGPSKDQIYDAIQIFGEDFNLEDADESDLDGEGEEDDDLMKEPGEASMTRRVEKMMSRYDREKVVEKFMTEADEKFRAKDVPERFVEASEVRPEVSDEERGMEARWIAKRLAVSISDDMVASGGDGLGPEENDVLPSAVERVLRYLHVERLEIPFIWFYRRDNLHQLLTRERLWFISEHDEKWDALLRLRSRIIDLLDALDKAAAVDQSLADAEVSMARSTVAELENTVDGLRGELLDAEDRAASQNGGDGEGGANESASTMVAELRERIGEQEVILDRERDALRLLENETSGTSQYSPDVARQVLALFPRSKYDGDLTPDEQLEEQQLTDIHGFLRLLIRGAQSAAEAEVKAKERARTEGLAESMAMGLDDGDDVGAVGNGGGSGVGERKSLRQSSASDAYAAARKIVGVRGFASDFMVPAYALGEGLRYGLNFKQDVPQPSVQDISIVFNEYAEETEGMPGAPREQRTLLRHVRHLMAAEIAAEPRVHSFMRELYRAHVTVSTRPTAKGVEVIGAFHDLFGLHLLSRKPVYTFFQDPKGPEMYVRLARAEKDGLLTISFDAPTVMLDDGNEVADLEFFLNANNSPGGMSLQHIATPTYAEDDEWQRERMEILRECVRTYLMPSLKKETVRELQRRGKEEIVVAAAAAYRKLANTGPYRVKPGPDGAGKDTEKFLLGRLEAISVVTVCLPGSNHDPTCLAAVDPAGKPIDNDMVPGRARGQLRERIKQFIKRSLPHVIAINMSAGRAARQMRNTIERNIIPSIVQMKREEAQRNNDMRRDAIESNAYTGMDYESDDENFDYKPDIILIKDDVSRIFAQSRRAANMFPDLDKHQAAALCLARFVQDPLPEYCNMWTICDGVGNFGFESLFLDLHPQQAELKGLRFQFLQALQRQLVDVVADAGVDLNMCLEHKHMAPQLSFVPGLGLRKADNVIQNLKRVLPQVTARQQLIDKGILGPCVFKNAAGFLKIDAVQDENRRVSPLERTRIHPECYTERNIVQRMCANAEGHEQWDASTALSHVLEVQKKSRKAIKQRCKEYDHLKWIEIWRNGERPGPSNFDVKRPQETGEDWQDTGEPVDSLCLLDLEHYDALLRQDDGGTDRTRIQMLNFIKDELRYPFLDMRPSLQEPSQQELFELVTGETDSQLHPGLHVLATVDKIPDDYSAFVRLEGGMMGHIELSEISDGHEHHTIASALTSGQQLRAVVIKVDKSRMRVEISTKPSYVKQPEAWFVQQRHANVWMEEWCRQTGRLRFDEYFNEKQALEELFRLDQDEEDRAKDLAADMAARSSVTVTAAGAQQNRVVARQVYHPTFKNVDHDGAETFLVETGDVGDCVIRPGSKGPDSLVLSWFFQNSPIVMIRHVDIREEDKSDSVGLGHKLFVRGIDQPYSDLDDIIQNYVGPMNDLIETMKEFKYFRAGSVESTEASMLAEKKANPKKVPFHVVLDPTQPGYFLLTWCIDANRPFEKEYIGLHPDGYKFRGTVYESPRRALAVWMEWLKEKMKRKPKSSTSGPAKSVPDRAAPPRRSRFGDAAPAPPVRSRGSRFSAVA